MHLTAPTDALLAEAYRDAGLWRSTSLRDGLERTSELDGERVAVIDNEASWTYAQLRERVDGTIATLLRAGLEAGDAILLVAPNSFDAVASILGTIRSGGVAVVLDRRCGSLDLANAVASSAARLAVVPSELRTSLCLDEHGVTVIELDQLATGGGDADWTEPHPAHARFVVFTSGTTGQAKGVVHTLESFGAGTRNLARVLGFNDRERPFLSSPIGTVTGLTQVLMSTAGGSIVLEDRFHPSGSLERIEAHEATMIGGAPVILEMLFDEYERRGTRRTSLQRIALGGTMIPQSVLDIAIDRFGITPTRVYGSSEIPVHTASRDDDSTDQRLADDGEPLPGSECTLGEMFEGGQELLVRGPNMFQGYLREEDNDAVFVDGWFRTGDLVEQHQRRVKVLGRLKDVVARKGLKVSLAEVDAAAMAIEGAIEVGAYGVPDEETGERVALAVHLPDGSSIDYDSVVEVLTIQGLARGKLPEEVVVWHEPLPRNASGKLVRSKLAVPSAGRATSCAPRLREIGPLTSPNL